MVEAALQPSEACLAELSVELWHQSRQPTQEPASHWLRTPAPSLHERLAQLLLVLGMKIILCIKDSTDPEITACLNS